MEVNQGTTYLPYLEMIQQIYKRLVILFLQRSISVPSLDNSSWKFEYHTFNKKIDINLIFEKHLIIWPNERKIVVERALKFIKNPKKISIANWYKLGKKTEIKVKISIIQIKKWLEESIKVIGNGRLDKQQ